jgi:hypothetical protein
MTLSGKLKAVTSMGIAERERRGLAVIAHRPGSSSFSGDTKAEPHEPAFQFALVWHAKDLDPVIVR